MSQSLLINPPDNGPDFEYYCLWLAREKYGPDVYLYTRKKQEGIDIYWEQMGKVIQCKQRAQPDPAELIRSLEQDFKTALTYFNQQLKHFVFASTVSLEQSSKKISRDNGLCESLMDVASRLAANYSVSIDCWHWDGIARDISDSPFLMAHLLDVEKGAELIHSAFIEQQSVHNNEALKQAYYGGKKAVQWCGIIEGLDAPRDTYKAAKQAIEQGFNHNQPIAALIKGDGGSGKSVLLRRLAYELHKDYTVYWLGSEIAQFLSCEWLYDIEKHKPTASNASTSKYLIFLEDWYQNVENSGTIGEAITLINKVAKMPHVRLVIGDRPVRQNVKKAYETHTLNSNTFELLAGENAHLLKAIFVNMPEWQIKTNEMQIKQVAQASLFQLLFVFQYAKDLTGEISDIYNRIFASDSRTLSNAGGYELALAKAVFFYANLYVNEGIFISVELLRDLAAYLGDCAIPSRYQTSIQAITNHAILKRYLGLDVVIYSNGKTNNWLRFHHDTMADKGWILLNIGQQYSESLTLSTLTYFEKTYLILSTLYNKRRHLSGERGMQIAREYLSLNIYHHSAAFNNCLSKLRNEACAKDAARKFLSTESPWKNFAVFCICLSLMKDEADTKKVARKFLNTENPWEIKEAFGACLALLKDEADTKKVAQKFLNTENPWEIKEAFGACLALLKDEADTKKVAQKFLSTESPWKNFAVFCICLSLMKDEADTKKVARKFLNTENPWEIKEAFGSCLALLKDEADTKKVARAFLSIENPWENYPVFCNCLVLVKDEKVGIDSAVAVLNRYAELNALHHWGMIYRSLECLHDKPQQQRLVARVVQDIINRRQSNEQYKIHFIQLLKLPLWNVSQWLRLTKKYIADWYKVRDNDKSQPIISRNALYSITISYRENTEQIKPMCLGIIRNWQFELRIKQRHQAYFIRCLAHPAIQNDMKLRQEMIKICADILHCVSQVNIDPPLIINEGTQVWLKNILEKNEFPKWDDE